MVKNLQYLPGLGRSDHVVLSFTLTCYTDWRSRCYQRLNFNKGDYDLLRSLLAKVDWSLMQGNEVHHAYQFFCNCSPGSSH